MLISGILMCQFLQDFIRNDDNDIEMRSWAWAYYGSAARASYTFFEITLSGCWPNYVRILLERVSHWYAIFFIFYVAFVNFAVIRIITAIFLKETMDMASNDAEMVASEQLRKKEAYLKKLHMFFEEADQDGS